MVLFHFIEQDYEIARKMDGVIYRLIISINIYEFRNQLVQQSFSYCENLLCSLQKPNVAAAVAAAVADAAAAGWLLLLLLCY